MRRWLSEDQIAKLLTKTERKMHEYTKTYLLIDNSCFLRSIFLVITFERMLMLLVLEVILAAPFKDFA